MLFKRMAVLGVGLIGGSLALAAKRAGLVGSVTGYDKRRADLQKALAMGVLDHYALSLPRAVENADCVLLSTPVGLLEPLARAIAPHLAANAIVTDVGSVKGERVSRIEQVLGNKAAFIGGHPIAGRETSGVSSALPELFKKSLSILTPTPKTNRKALRQVGQLWKGVGASVIEMDPYEHDRIMATVSHLPHLLAYALMELFFHPRVTLRGLPFSGGGLRDFTRIADSPPALWHDIFRLNKEALCEAINHYQETLEKLKKAIINAKPYSQSGHLDSEKNEDPLLTLLNHAKTVREKIPS